VSITKRIDAVTDISKVKVSRPPAPHSLKIELSGRCNLSCQMCSLRNREQQPTQDMDFDAFCKLVDEFKAAGGQEVGLFYLGESLMNFDLTERALRYCKQIGIGYVFLTTNGTLARPPVVKRLFEAGLDSLKFSVNAADEEQYEQIMGVSGRLFNSMLHNLEQARRIRDEGDYACGIYASSILFDGEQRERMQRLIDERVKPFVDEHYFLPLYGQMSSQSTERSKELGFVPTAGNQGRVGALRDPLPCWALWHGHVRSEQGRPVLTACCFGADATFDMADLSAVSFLEGWHSDKFVALREAHLRKDVSGTVCENCLAYQ